jgi:hypothetical protein
MVITARRSHSISSCWDLVLGNSLHFPVQWSSSMRNAVMGVAKLVGHKAIQMTTRYAHLAPEHECEAVERLANPTAEKTAISVSHTRTQTSPPDLRSHPKTV